MNSSFLICAFPRSRTFWLSRFLSIDGVSVCTHEATEHAGSAEQFWDNAERSATGCRIYGNSDSANNYVLPSILAKMPLTRVVWIERPMDEVKASMETMGMPMDPESIDNLMHFRRLHEHLFDLVIPFHELCYMPVCKQLWEFCLPGEPFDYGRWGIYSCLKLGYSKESPMPEKDFSKLLRWIMHEVDELRKEKLM